MSTREESDPGRSLMDIEAVQVIRDIKGCVSKNMEAAMKTNSKQDDLHAQNPQNVINQKKISDVMLQRLNTGKIGQI